MDSFLKQKTIHATEILTLLENAKMSKKGHKSTEQACFMKGETDDFKAGHDTLPEIPDALNRHFKMLYEIVGDPDIEIYVNDWTIMSLNEALAKYEHYKNDGQENIFDIAYVYCGMGHIDVLSCNLHNHLLFMRRDGGSNGWDREYNYLQAKNFDYRKYEYFYFNSWKNKL
jgi:hypothetical protein|tara:strand:- start:6 stop:518 length:513 start_codon:yes stop_codon:yes gene_type:complete